MSFDNQGGEDRVLTDGITSDEAEIDFMDAVDKFAEGWYDDDGELREGWESADLDDQDGYWPDAYSSDGFGNVSGRYERGAGCPWCGTVGPHVCYA